MHDHSHSTLLVKLNGHGPTAQRARLRAFCRGNAADMEAAAEALRARERGENAQLPPGVIADPTREQIARELGVDPKTIPNGAWSKIFAMASARKGGPRQFTDAQAEEAVVSTITTGLFTKIPSHRLIPVDAFMVEKWRILYAAALSLRKAAAIVTTRSVNEVLKRSGAFKRLQQLCDPENVFSETWSLWHQEIKDVSLSLAPSTLPVEDSLIHLNALYANREDHRIGKALSDGTLTRAQASKALAALPQVDGANGADGVKLTAMTVSQILAHEDNPADILLSNGYLERGSPCVLCGPPGIGKSRLALQLAIKSVLGNGFLGWETTAPGLKWAFLQNENGLRRLKADLRAMTKDMNGAKLAELEKHILLHVIVTDTDGHLDLSDPDARRRVIEFVQDSQPDIVVGDPLTAFSLGDLNSDQEMLNTARDFGRIVRQGDPRRIPFLIHHARTGKEARAGVAGADRSSYARNSKALYGWTRAQFNMAPIDKDNNDRLLFASGKCNNAPEFPKFIIALELDSMFYAKTDEDPDAALEEMQGEDGKFKEKFTRKQIAGLMSPVTPLAQKDIKKKAIDKIHMSGRTFDTLWKELKEFEEIEETGDKKWLKK